MTSKQEGRVVIVGSGLIGCSWAMVFASAGFQVKLYDVVQEQITRALEKIRVQMKELEEIGMLKGTLNTEQQLSLISGCTDLKEAVEGSVYVQECTPENLELKKKIFGQLDLLADNNVILSSSTSCLLPTKLFTGLKHVKQCIVAHPVNPPYYVPLVELVPHPETDPCTLEKTYALMKKIGQSPVRLTKEIDGFVLNRLQYAIISEAWRLASVRMLNYCERYREGMIRVLKSFGPIPDFAGAAEEKINTAMCEETPPDSEHLNARRRWRDNCLVRLAKLKKEIKHNDSHKH
ncbi:lambda-crystallin homolog [Sphaerodactylus townsendi]|uniref:lambda-crystallin homolog n=1 Tax=Sphaerodactylus townsendi TaxID=933632 RepID=UPI002025F339|nr:lambda-crystallin homolog [Sphaerodactylus townsendi]